jgi:hypothetical protein
MRRFSALAGLSAARGDLYRYWVKLKAISGG